jgi:hypothetical protein
MFGVVMSVLQELRAHARIPEIAQVRGDRGHRFMMLLGALEEGADLVGHLDEPLNFHRSAPGQGLGFIAF